MAATWKCHSRWLRSAGVVWSDDLEHWVKPVEGPVMLADDLDAAATQIYGMPVFAYQGMYIGHPWLYHARIWKNGGYSPSRMYEAQEGSIRTMDTHIAWSWDLINWTRTPKRELLDRYDHVIPGFEWYYCSAFTGDSVRGELTWAKHPTFGDIRKPPTKWNTFPTFPDGVIDKDKKIRFRIKNANLFSYLPADINQQIDNGWPD